jgi:tetratricopeptide (TPR) repeat protein
MKSFLCFAKSFYCVVLIVYSHTISFAQPNAMSPTGTMPAKPGDCCKSPIMCLKPMEPAVIMDGIGKSHFAVTTKSAKCQQFFDQGLALLQDFWDLEAFRSFKEAAKNDSSCAMAYWGVAFALVEGHAFPSDSTVLSETKRAIERARQFRDNATPEEKMIISIELKRDSLRQAGLADQIDSLTSGDIQTYINQYPDNPDMVNIHVIKLFAKYDAQRHPKGTQLLAEYILRGMLQKYPDHHGLNHYYIHAVESGPYPERAVNAAEKVVVLAPKSGHMVHMAGHTYYNTGNYAKAHDAFLAAYKVDSAYINDKKVSRIDYWHYDHNITFMIMNCAEDGRLKEGLMWGEVISKIDTTNFSFMDPKNSSGKGVLAYHSGIPYYAKAEICMRYGDWQKAYETLMSMPDSLNGDKYYLLFCKGMAALGNNDVDSAEKAATEYEALAYRNNATWYVVKLLGYVLRMHVLTAEGKYNEAVPYFQKALDEEKRTDMFNDPARSVNASHEIGIICRENKEYEKAIAAFNDELKVFRLSGQVYYEMAKTYAAWGRKKEAKQYYEKLLEAWKYGDNDLPQIIEAKEWLKNISLSKQKLRKCAYK